MWGPGAHRLMLPVPLKYTERKVGITHHKTR